MGIRIDDLDAAASAQADHAIPAMRSNRTVKVTVQQIATYITADRQAFTTYTTKSAGYTAAKTDAGAIHRCSAELTVSLTAATTLGANWTLTIIADGGDVTIDADGTELINGEETLVVADGDAAYIICTGTAFKAIVITAAANMAAKYALKTGNYTALDADTNTSIRFTSAATLSFDVTANLRTNWRIEVWNDSTGNVVLDPNSTDTVNGAATLVLQPGQKAEIFKTGSTTFQASVFGDALSGPQLQGYAYGLSLSTSATDAANDIDIAAGAAGSDASPFYLLQLASALTKRIDAAWAVGANQGGLDTGSVTNATYYIWLIQRSDTLVTDALFSLSSTAPTMPANYDRKRLLGYFVRAGGANGAITTIGVPVFTKEYISTEQVMVVGGALTLAHGLGSVPKLLQARIVCKTAEATYAVGDEVVMSFPDDSSGSVSAGQLMPTATDIFIRMNSNLIVGAKTSGSRVILTPANWRLIVRAWA